MGTRFHMGIFQSLTRFHIVVFIWGLTEKSPYGNGFHMGTPVSIWESPYGNAKNYHMGNPRSEKEFVTIWGLTYIRMYELELFFCPCVSCCKVFFGWASFFVKIHQKFVSFVHLCM
jgi:hypothetical protein